MPSAFPDLDKFIHATEYALLAGLFVRAVLGTNQNAWFPLVWAIAVFFVAFYGITDEFHQSFVVGRSSDLKDWMADTVGGMIGASIYLFWQTKLNKNSSRG
jgi:VanZ family protein